MPMQYAYGCSDLVTVFHRTLCYLAHIFYTYYTFPFIIVPYVQVDDKIKKFKGLLFIIDHSNG